jgi:heme A synthase
MDFRDQIVKEALDKTIGEWRPEATRRARVRRILVVVALTLAVVVGFWTVLYLSTPKPREPGERKPVAVELLPPPR